jgi:hypothetical protein
MTAEEMQSSLSLLAYFFSDSFVLLCVVGLQVFFSRAHNFGLLLFALIVPVSYHHWLRDANG